MKLELLRNASEYGEDIVRLFDYSLAESNGLIYENK